jgi:hypothetical protein
MSRPCVSVKPGIEQRSTTTEFNRSFSEHIHFDLPGWNTPTKFSCELSKLSFWISRLGDWALAPVPTSKIVASAKAADVVDPDFSPGQSLPKTAKVGGSKPFFNSQVKSYDSCIS